MANQTVHNPQSVTIGSTSLTDVTSISWGEQRQLISQGADAELYPCAAGFGEASCTGQITFRDPAAADAAKGATGTLGATLEGLGSAADETLSIVGVVAGGNSTQVGRGQAASSTVPFVYISSDGTTDPVTIT